MSLICLTNRTTILSDADVRTAMAALQIQVTRDWFPAWGSSATLQFLPQDAASPTGAWELALLDDTDQAADLGYHETTSAGTPLGKVFAATDRKYGLNWTVTASHELLEMLGDPEANRSIGFEGSLYALEVCDPVEDSAFEYSINGVDVSDFVYPRYFLPSAAVGRYDHGAYLDAGMPMLLKGGYASVCRDGTWQEEYGELAPIDRGRLERGFHRRILRATPHSARRRSRGSSLIGKVPGAPANGAPLPTKAE